MNTTTMTRRMYHRAVRLLACVLGAWFMTGTGVAADAMSRPAPAADSLRLDTRADQEAAFRTGLELFAAGMKLHGTDRAGAQAMFSSAAATWRSIALNAKIHNPQLELNIANASLLAGEPARAIAAFRRAQALDPSDANIAGGLAAARRTAGTESLAPNAAAVPADPGEGGIAGTIRGIGRFLAYAADRTIRWFPVRLVLTVAAVCYLATFALGIAAAFRWRGISLRHAFVAGLLCLLVAGPVIAIEISEKGVRDAVVIQDGLIARSGPAEMYDPAFKEPVRPGVECRVVETRSSWVLLLLWDGRRAWIPQSAVEFISH
jgi:hypothetical protein